jgi:hypothetical protein
MTGAAAMYVTGLDIDSGEPIRVMRHAGERERQKRALRPNRVPRSRTSPLDTVD